MRWWWVSAGVIIAVFAIITVVSVRDDAPGYTPLPALSTAPRETPVVLKSPTDGGLRVVEQGFTQRDQPTEKTLTPGYGPGRPEPYKPVYAAFTLENTSTVDVAFQPKVKVTYFDDRNKAIPDRNASSTWTGPLMPGAKATFAAFLILDSVPVTRMTVAVTGADWMPATQAKTMLRYAPMTARDVTVLPAAVPGLTTVTWTATNEHTEPQHATGFVIYRDAAGKLLGAQTTDTLGNEDLNLPPGDSTGSVTFKTYFPPGTDRSRLQVTLRPGFPAHDLY